jgi:hypothetical protein
MRFFPPEYIDKAMQEIQIMEDKRILEILDLICPKCNGLKSTKNIEHTELECDLEFTKQVIES